VNLSKTLQLCFFNQKCYKKKLFRWFLKDHVTLKTRVMMLKIQLCHHNNKTLTKSYWLPYIKEVQRDVISWQTQRIDYQQNRPVDLNPSLQMRTWCKIRHQYIFQTMKRWGFDEVMMNQEQTMLSAWGAGPMKMEKLQWCNKRNKTYKISKGRGKQK